MTQQSDKIDFIISMLQKKTTLTDTKQQYIQHKLCKISYINWYTKLFYLQPSQQHYNWTTHEKSHI